MYSYTCSLGAWRFKVGAHDLQNLMGLSVRSFQNVPGTVVGVEMFFWHILVRFCVLCKSGRIHGFHFGRDPQLFLTPDIQKYVFHCRRYYFDDWLLFVWKSFRQTFKPSNTRRSQPQVSTYPVAQLRSLGLSSWPFSQEDTGESFCPSHALPKDIALWVRTPNTEVLLSQR